MKATNRRGESARAPTRRLVMHMLLFGIVLCSVVAAPLLLQPDKPIQPSGAGLAPAAQTAKPPTPAYSTYTSWEAMDKAIDAQYATVIRVSGTNGYTGFWFFGLEQFDGMNRYALGMTVYF